MDHEKVTIVIATLRRLLKKKGGLQVYCKFFWLGQEYRTDTYKNGQDESEVSIMEKFTIDIYPSISKLFKVQIIDEHGMGPVVIGQLALDLGELQSKVSDGFYDLLPPSREDAPREKGMYGRIRLRLVKEVTKSDPILELSSVLPPIEDGSPGANSSSRPITEAERRELYDKNKLRAALREEGQEEVKKVDIQTGGKAVAAFWEIKGHLPNIDDNRIHAALQEYNCNISEALEFLMNKEMKGMRENRPMEYIDQNEEDIKNQALEQERHIDRKEHFLKANAGELLDVPLFADGYQCKPSNRYKALIMGLGYPGVEEINCRDRSLRDSKMVNSWLRDVCGWSQANCIYMIHDNHADSRCTGTKKNIIEGFQWLVKDVTPGDALFVYFSGHGGVADPLTNSGHMDPCPGFDGLRPYWYSNDMKILDVATIYKEVLFNIPAGVRITFLIDCPNFHLWQPFFFNPRSLHFGATTHRYFLPCDARVFCSIGDSSLSQVTFSQIFCSIACSKQQEKASMYDFLFTLCERAKEAYGDAPLKLFKDYICRTHHYSSCQEVDLRVQFSLHDVVPNCNMRLGPSMIHGHEPKGAAPLPHILTKEEARQREERMKNKASQQRVGLDDTRPRVFDKLKTKLRDREQRKTQR